MSNQSLDKTISVLNDLIETSKDGEAGFRTCAEDVKNAELKTLFTSRARECATAAEELQAMVLGFGGTPENDTSVAGDLHRRWVDLKSLVSGKDEESILNECERGEDVAKKRYAEALKNELPLNVRELVQRQYEGVLRNHDQIKALRNTARARS
ncbi:PA2169 family four-helix-bundle protein [Pseudomonas sp. EA_35y_Pfl2_R111]|uniref:PA2169 family four-helix-bundle protein n=1 Tax=Pseudomonas sp. EA_35y_Pfl2_R111 TaxID=3088689 RepID=UPI0030DA208D